jgi:hypothetical protein
MKNLAVLLFPVLFTVCSSSPEKLVTVDVSKGVWQPTTLTVLGPMSDESADPNPFLDVRLDVTFENGTKAVTVPGFYAADGSAGESGASTGSVWKAVFVPDEPGRWTYSLSFRGGKSVALGESGSSEALAADAVKGEFEVPINGDATKPRGMLRYVGQRYLQFAGAGSYFLKSGADSPENFLAFEDFDGDEASERLAQREGEARASSRHRYEPHIRDWKVGDPTWRGGKGKGIIGALNYLASKGVNSVYFLTMNIEGDGNDVWPYSSPQERYRFDCSKLDQWEVVFSHMDDLGMMLHVVLTETENESLFESEEGTEFAESRKIYYRELIARFAHHRALVWNLGEENGWNDDKEGTLEPENRANSDSQRRAFSDYIRALDPYDHPIVVHTLPGRYDEIYTPLLGHPSLEGPSLQMHLGEEIYSETLKWVEKSKESGRQWFACLDEIGPADTGVMPDADDPEHDSVRRYALWGNLMAGGAGCEWYFGYKYAHNDLGLEDYRSRERMWDLNRNAVDFFQQHLPFHEMEPDDGLIDDANSHCLAKPGSVYAVYLGEGGSTRIALPVGEYSLQWFDPRHGGPLQVGRVERLQGGGSRSIGAAPRDPGKDWVALIKRVGNNGEAL